MNREVKGEKKCLLGQHQHVTWREPGASFRPSRRVTKISLLPMGQNGGTLLDLPLFQGALPAVHNTEINRKKY